MYKNVSKKEENTKESGNKKLGEELNNILKYIGIFRVSFEGRKNNREKKDKNKGESASYVIKKKGRNKKL